MRTLVDDLCSDACEGRSAGSEGGRLARKIVVDALRGAGLDPFEQEVPECRGANVLATVKGDIDRYVLVAAHYDHIGRDREGIYRGADDNAAAVAILVEVARGLANASSDGDGAARARIGGKLQGRGVIIAAFDAEEPPHFMQDSMGSLHFVRNPTVPLDRIDLMVCMDLVGHAVGESDALPADVRNTMFALGGERSTGTRERLEALGRAEPGVVVRSADAQIIPPLSDHYAFWKAKRPFMLLTNGRSRRYHTVDDTPEHLDYDKMGATARWLERFVRDACARGEKRFEFRDARDDVSTLDSLIDVLATLEHFSPEAAAGLARARELRGHCQRDRSLPEPLHFEVEMLVLAIEQALS